MAEIESPVIIKKITIVSGGHHGGAWKVAYADFVTAMMAFFLLLWLLSAASEETKEGLSEYFAPTVGISGAAGIGFEGGKTMNVDGTLNSDKTPVAIVVGKAPPGMAPGAPEKKSLIEAEDEANLFEKAAEEIKKSFEDDPTLSELKDNIIVEQTAEGLKIEMLDSDRKSMFEDGSKHLSHFGKVILGRISELVQRMPNYISITGHTDKSGYEKEATGYTNWEISADRANIARQFMISTDMKTERVAKVVGRADRELLLPDVPLSPRNRRITVILLRGDHMIIPIDQKSATRSLLSVPRVNMNPTPATASNISKQKNEKDVEDIGEDTPVIEFDNDVMSMPSDSGSSVNNNDLPPINRDANSPHSSSPSIGTIH